MIRYALLIIGACCGLLQAATVSGVVTDSVAGTKLDSIRVQLRSGTQVVATDTTNAEGVYSFANVDTGQYTIRASKTGYTTKSVAETVDTGESDVAVNIALAVIIRTTVAGIVTDSAKVTALANVAVQLRSGTQTLRIDTTGSDGKYSFENVDTGDYTVRASLSGYTTKSLAAAVTDSTPVTVNIALATIVTATVSGTVKDSATAAPLPGAVVQLRKSSATVATDTCDSAGKYSFDEVEAANYTVRASLAGYTTKSLTAAVTSSAAVTVDIPLVHVVTATLAGTIRDSATATALAGAIVQLRKGSATVRTDTSDTAGNYSFEKVEAGNYTVRASLALYTTTTLAATVTSSAPVTADIPLVALVTATVNGKVTDTATGAGAAISGAIVQLRSGLTIIAVDTSGSDGAFSFAKVERGGYTIRVSFAGYTTKSVNAPVTDSTAITVNVPLALIAYGTVIGTVTADSLTGEALDGVTVILNRSGAGGAASDTATTDAQGGYSFDKVEAAVGYTLRGSKTGYAAASAGLADKKNGTDTVDFFMKRLLTKDIFISVLTAADTTSIAEAAVTFTTSGGSTVIARSTDSTGNVLFEKVEEGTYVIAASVSGFTAGSRQYAVNVASTDSIKIFLPAADGGTKTLSGTVIDSVSGNALANVTVSIRIDGGGTPVMLATTTAANGAYTIAGIPIAAAATTLTAKLTDYKISARNVTLGTVNTADTTKFDFKIISNAAVVIEREIAPINDGRPYAAVSPDGVISLFNFTGTGVVRLFGLDGRLICQRPFNSAGRSALTLQRQKRLPRATVIVRVSGADGGRDIVGKAVMVNR